MKKVLLLHTGGTVGMRPRQPDEVLAPGEFGPTLRELVPELSRVAEIEARVLFNLDSTDLGPEHWLQLAQAIHATGSDYDGVVVTHGTDAMASTAAALSFLLRGLPFPVVLTGSQRPLSDVHSDGRTNLLGAVDLATRGIREVGIYFDGQLLRGNRTVKRDTFGFAAFESPHFPPLAEIGTSVRVHAAALPDRGPGFDVDGGFDPRICAIWLHPGTDGFVLRGLVPHEPRAVLLIAPGVGNIPVSTPQVGEAIEELVGAGCVVAIGSQARGGGSDLSLYAGGRLALDRGAVGIGDMTVETALVKLMWLAQRHPGADAVRAALHEDVAGEITLGG